MFGLPTLSEILEALSVLGEEPAAYAVLVTALLLVVLRDWRYALVALSAQFVLAGWLLTSVLQAQQVGILKMLVGLIICLILYFTARQVRWGETSPVAAPPAEPAEGQADSAEKNSAATPLAHRPIPINLLFRLLVGGLTAVVVLYVTRNGIIVLPQVMEHINLASVALMGLGMVQLGITDEPLTAGIGLLTTVTGFELFYHSLEQGIVVITLMIGVDLLIAVVIAYLTVARHLKPNQTDGRSQL